MRVTIEHEEIQHGLIFKKTLHAVKCAIDFSDEERHLIESNNIGTVIVLERDPSADAKVYENDVPEKFFLRIQDFLYGPDVYCLHTPGEAKMYEAELTEKLPELKNYIMANDEVEEKKKTLEF